MVDVYRTAAEPDPPACMLCLVPMVFDVMWTHWICRKCGTCDCVMPKRSTDR